MRKQFFLAVILLCWSGSPAAAGGISDEDVSSIEVITLALHRVASVEEGGKRNLHDLANLMIPEGHATFIRHVDGKTTHTMSFVRDWMENEQLPAAKGSLEKVVEMKTQRNDKFANVWAEYEIREVSDGPVVRRGITNLQVYNDGERWWILGWQDEEIASRD